MAKTLVVVESPAKAKTIKKYLGAGYEVMASKGHVKDLPKKLGIDVEDGFKETYEIIEAKSKVLAELKTEAKKSEALLLATDPDREGEAIAWHIAEELKRPKLPIKRVEFHEITKKGVEAGLAHPRELDQHLYGAQRARRVLDRIVGYDVSALVWSKLAFGLSAGRVQSVALRLIVEREREIENFVPEEYWNLGASLKGKDTTPIFARLTKADGEKLEVKNADQSSGVVAALKNAKYKVVKVTKRQQKRNAPAPYTTSKLQQDATSYLRFTTKRTMNIAQKLYEGVDLKDDGGQVGLITYMRTDSTRVGADAVEEARVHILEQHGKEFLPEKPNVFKLKQGAQDAHEAIRPTSMLLAPEKVKKHLTEEQYKLYKLIWDRFVASQMSHALYDQTGVDIEAEPTARAPHRVYGLRVGGKVLKFAGWLDQYNRVSDGQKEYAGEGEEEAGASPALVGVAAARGDEDTEGLLPELKEGEVLTLVDPPGVSADQKFTQPPPRFNEGSLVRELERRGIGRPSTYADIIAKVQARDYVERLEGGQMKATNLGKIVIDGLIGTTLDFMDPDFTANLEKELDEVAAGRLDRVDLLTKFYGRFRERLNIAKKGERWAPEPQPTEHKCEECGGIMLKRWSRNGWFLGCENYPKCKVTQDISDEGTPLKPVLTDYKCDECQRPMIIKTGRFGQFLSCSGYPECKTTRPVPLGVPCPKCAGDIVEVRSKKKGARSFYGCANYPKCDFRSWQKPVLEPCPLCAHPFLVYGGGKKTPKLMCPRGKECGYSRDVDDAEALLGGGAGAEDGELASAQAG
ncbi:MAG: type I DNA topoisomerase [Polyangiaceae bacterium]|nr:type I DNA topoisomerase [Polyangiaceae bacterium]